MGKVWECQVSWLIYLWGLEYTHLKLELMFTIWLLFSSLQNFEEVQTIYLYYVHCFIFSIMPCIKLPTGRKEPWGKTVPFFCAFVILKTIVENMLSHQRLFFHKPSIYSLHLGGWSWRIKNLNQTRLHSKTPFHKTEQRIG